MSDLWIAIATMTSIALMLGLVAGWLAPSQRQSQMLVIAIASFATFAFIFYASGHLFWAKWIPLSAAIVWSNLTPWLAAIVAGVCWRLEGTPRWRRLFMTLAFASISLATAFYPFLNISLRPQPDGGNVWNGPVALQTSWATCSPAAAATFLNAGGIPMTEADMIPRCLTDASGTPTLGLFRGVKLAATEHGRDVQVGSFTLDQLMTTHTNWPVLLMVKLPRSGVDDPRYADQWGWIPGMGHSVVALGTTTDGRLVIADPATGVEAWSSKDLSVLWHGDAIAFTP